MTSFSEHLYYIPVEITGEYNITLEYFPLALHLHDSFISFLIFILLLTKTIKKF